MTVIEFKVAATVADVVITSEKPDTDYLTIANQLLGPVGARRFMHALQTSGRQSYSFKPISQWDIVDAAYTISLMDPWVDAHLRHVLNEYLGADGYEIIEQEIEAIVYGCFRLSKRFKVFVKDWLKPEIVVAIIIAFAQHSSTPQPLQPDPYQPSFRIECQLIEDDPALLSFHLQQVLLSEQGFDYSNPACIVLLQRALAEAGFSPGAIDGAYGPVTRRAEQRYAASKGLDGDGRHLHFLIDDIRQS